MTRTVSIIVAALLLATPAAHAQKSKKNVSEAKKWFDAGKQAYAAGQYGVAAAAFDQAYAMVPRTAILFSAAQSYRLQYYISKKPRDLKRAIELYQLYIKRVKHGGRRGHAIEFVAVLMPVWNQIKANMGKDGGQLETPTQFLVSSSTPKAKVSLAGKEAVDIPATLTIKPGRYKLRIFAPGYFARVVDELAVKGRMSVVRIDLKPKPAIISVKAPDDAKILVDGRLYGNTPLPKPLVLSAGRHYIALTRRGHKPFTKDLVVKRGEQLEMDVKLRRTGQRRLSYWVGATSVALLGGGTITSLLALSAQSSAKNIQRMFTEGQTNITDEQRLEFNDALSRRDRWRTISLGLFTGGAVVGVTAALLYWLDTPVAEAPKRRIVPLLNDGGVGAGVTGSF